MRKREWPVKLVAIDLRAFDGCFKEDADASDEKIRIDDEGKAPSRSQSDRIEKLSGLSVGPHAEAWIGSSAFSAAIAMFLASFAALPHHDDDTPIALLYTYYTATSVLVSVLVLKLVWVPVVDLVTEVNMILSKTALYINKIVMPNTKSSCMKDIGLFLGTKTAVVWTTNLLSLLFLYSVSTDVLNYMALYFYSLPRKGLLARMRSVALRAIDTVLYMMSSKKHVRFHWESEIKYYSPNVNQQNLSQCFDDDEDDDL